VDDVTDTLEMNTATTAGRAAGRTSARSSGRSSEKTSGTSDRRERLASQLPTRTLIFGMAHDDGQILAEELFPVAEACGQSASQVHSCIRRMVAEGLLELSAGQGRSASYVATASGQQVLRSLFAKTRLAYGQDAAGSGWDRCWRLVGFAVAESKRAVRDRFREHLRSLGGAALQQGLYVSPHPWEEEVRAQARRLGIEDQVTYATTDDLVVGGESDPRSIAAALWPLEELASRYQALVDDLRSVPAALAAMRNRHERLGDDLFLSGALAVAVAFQECFQDDPLLPPELLPRPWPGRVARDLLVQCRKMAMVIRSTHGTPVPFRYFDAAVEATLGLS
jgi:phenylacetic acid degradation operon negative regulatory protein